MCLAVLRPDVDICCMLITYMHVGRQAMAASGDECASRQRIAHIELEVTRLGDRIDACADASERIELIKWLTAIQTEKNKLIQRLPVAAPPPASVVGGGPLSLSKLLASLFYARVAEMHAFFCTEADDLGDPWRRVLGLWCGNIPVVRSPPSVDGVTLDMPVDASPMRHGASNDFMPGPSNVQRRKA
jgi:hypothetical protein